MTMPTKGRVEYGARAFEQDASLAIRGDVIRALIELITNCDDAYGTSQGEIWIRVTSHDDADFKACIQVQDSAKGLSAEGLQKAFAVLGGEKTDDDGAGEVRGLLGRGAKDVASLGRIEFAAIKDGKYSKLSLEGTGEWELTDINVVATEEHRHALALEEGENGLTATLYVAEKFKVPSRNQMHDKLAHHAQLRDLVARRPVYLKDSLMTVRIDAPPILGDVVVDTDLELDGYDPVHLRVRRLPHRASGPVNEFSDQGLLIRSGVTVFQNTWFDLEGRPEAAYFAGELEAPQIASVIRAFDKKEPIGGPIRLLSRDRDGLVKTHPYRKELARAVTREVLPLFEALSKQMDAGKKQGAELSKAFKVAGDALKEQLTAVLEEIDDDDSDGGGGATRLADFAVIPPRRVMTPGSTATLTVRAKSAPHSPQSVTIEQQSSDDVLAAVAASEDGWTKHSRLDCVVSHVYVDAGLDLGTAVVRIDAGTHTTRAELVVTNIEPQEVEPPTALTFVAMKTTISPTRGRRLELRAPIDRLDESVAVTFEGTGVATWSDPVTLKAEPGGRWTTAVVKCKASAEPGEGTLTASQGDETTACAVTVAEAAGRGGLNLEFDLSGHKNPSRRVELTNDQGAIFVRVYAFHPTFNGVFGKYVDAENKFAGEDSPQARAVLAEVVASELAAHLTERDYNRRPEQLNDAPRVLFRRTELANRFLAILHRALAPAAS